MAVTIIPTVTNQDGSWQNPINATDNNTSTESHVTVYSSTYMNFNFTNILTTIKKNDSNIKSADDVTITDATMKVRCRIPSSTGSKYFAMSVVASPYSDQQEIIYKDTATMSSSATDYTGNMTSYFEKNKARFLNNGFDVKFTVHNSSGTGYLFYLAEISLSISFSVRGTGLMYGSNKIKTITVGGENIQAVYLGTTEIFGSMEEVDAPSNSESSDIGSSSSLTNIALKNVSWDTGSKVADTIYASTDNRYKISDLLPDSAASVIKLEFVSSDSSGNINLTGMYNGGFFINLWSTESHDSYIDRFNVAIEVKQNVDLSTPNKAVYYLSVGDLKAIDSTKINMSTVLSYITFGFKLKLLTGGPTSIDPSLYKLNITKM